MGRPLAGVLLAMIVTSCGIGGTSATFGSEELSTDPSDIEVVADLFGPDYFSDDRTPVRAFVPKEDEEAFKELMREAAMGLGPEATDLFVLETEVSGDSAKVQYGGQFCHFEPVDPNASPPVPNEESCEAVVSRNDSFAPRAVVFFKRSGGDDWKFDLEAQAAYDEGL